MRYVWSLVMAAGLMMVQPSSADAQFSLSIGNPYYGNGISIGSPYGYGYNSFSNYGYGPGLYGSNFYGSGYGAPYLGGYGVTSYGYRGYSSGYRGYSTPYAGGYRPYGGYGYGNRGFRPGVPYGRFGGFRR